MSPVIHTIFVGKNKCYLPTNQVNAKSFYDLAYDRKVTIDQQNYRDFEKLLQYLGMANELGNPVVNMQILDLPSTIDLHSVGMPSNIDLHSGLTSDMVCIM